MTPEEAAEAAKAGVPGATAADHRRTSRRRSLAARPRRVRCCRWADCNRVPPPRAPPRLRRRSVFRTGLTRTPPLRTRHRRRRRSVQRGPGSPVRWRQPRRWCRWRATPLRSTARGMPMRRRRGCSRMESPRRLRRPPALLLALPAALRVSPRPPRTRARPHRCCPRPVARRPYRCRSWRQRSRGPPLRPHRSRPGVIPRLNCLPAR